MRWYHWVFILGAATSSGLPPLAFLFVVGLVGSLVYDIAPDIIRSLPALPGRAYHSARALTLREPDKALPAPSPEMAALAADLTADDDAPPPRRPAAPRPAQQAQAAPRPRTLTPQEFAGDPLFKALDADPHRFIIGHTQGGKSTAMHAMAQAWASRGEPVIVCDPDAARGQWPGCEVAGYAEDYRGIGQAIERVEVAFDERSRLYADGQRDFEPMHLVIDEVHEVFDNVPGARDFVLDTLGRRGAKRGIRVTIGTQDQNKDTLGLESAAVLSNFITAELQKDEKGRRVATVYRGNAAKRQHTKEYALPPLPGAKTFIKAKEEPAPRRAAVAAEQRPAVVSVRVPERAAAAPSDLLASLMAETLPANIKAQVSAISPEREARLVRILQHQEATGTAQASPVPIVPRDSEGHRDTSAGTLVLPGDGREVHLHVHANAEAHAPAATTPAQPWKRQGPVVQRRKATRDTAEDLYRAYREGGAAGKSYRALYRELGGSKQTTLAAWQEGKAGRK